MNYWDALGLEVEAEYDPVAGVLTVIDKEKNTSASVRASSVGKPKGDPIPSGVYDILEHAARPNFYRLESKDKPYGDDVHQDTGRSEFRLHLPGQGNTTGCISVDEQKNWEKIKAIIENTSTSTEKVQSKSFFGKSHETLKNMGS